MMGNPRTAQDGDKENGREGFAHVSCLCPVEQPGEDFTAKDKYHSHDHDGRYSIPPGMQVRRSSSGEHWNEGHEWHNSQILKQEHSECCFPMLLIEFVFSFQYPEDEGCRGVCQHEP